MILSLIAIFWVGWVIGAGTGVDDSYANILSLVALVGSLSALFYYAGVGAGTW